MDKQLQEKLRLLKLDLLYFLNVLSVSESFAPDLEEISQSTNTPESDLRGVISTLRRMKFHDEPLIVAAGRDNDGRLRWKINEKVVNKNELAKFLEEEILGKEGIKISP